MRWKVAFQRARKVRSLLKHLASMAAETASAVPPAEQYAPRRMTGSRGAPLVGSTMTLEVMEASPFLVVSSKPSMRMA